MSGFQQGGGTKDSPTNFFSGLTEIITLDENKPNSDKRPPIDYLYTDKTDFTYISLDKYLFDDKGNPKTVFVLFYEQEIIDEEERRKYEQAEADNDENEKGKILGRVGNKLREPIISKLFNRTDKKDSKIEELIKEKEILVIKIKNPKKKTFFNTPRFRREPNEEYQPKNLEECLKKIGEQNFHPFNWMKNRPRKYIDDQENPPIQLLPILLVYKLGVPVMMYEGPYGNSDTEDEKKEINILYGIMTNFINEITGSEGIPNVTQQDRWNTIFKDLWDEYNKNIVNPGLPVQIRLLGEKNLSKKINEASYSDYTFEYDSLPALRPSNSSYNEIINESYIPQGECVQEDCEYELIYKVDKLKKEISTSTNNSDKKRDIIQKSKEFKYKQPDYELEYTFTPKIKLTESEQKDLEKELSNAISIAKSIEEAAKPKKEERGGQERGGQERGGQERGGQERGGQERGGQERGGQKIEERKVENKPGGLAGVKANIVNIGK
jgi:hypothetical protein